MLFLYRPRETWMPFSAPRNRTDQAAYNRSLQRQFASTRRVPPPIPALETGDQIHELQALHTSGALTDAEFEAAAARVRGG